MTDSAPLDEMVDGASHVRPHWRGVFGTLFSLGHETLAERAELLERAFVDEGISAILPGEQHVNWRCDPIPLILSAAEFASLETGLAQRARLLDAILADIHGAGTLVELGAIPPELVYGNPGFLRPLRIGGSDAVATRHLHIYAADLMRGPDGVWRVLADRTDQARGLAYALENRRNLARIVPEIFQHQQIEPLRPFMESTGEALRALAPGGEGGIALLSGGHTDPLWFEHVLLARELSIGLVEPGDLTVRGGIVYLKTLRGLERIGVLLRRQPGNRMDPLELAHSPGPPGLLDAMRAGSVHIVNHPGSALAESPGLAEFLPAIARRLLGEDLLTPSQATLWLGDGANLRTVMRDLEGWVIRHATDGASVPVVPTHLTAGEREELAARVTAKPADYAAFMAPSPSVAPCSTASGLEARPVVLRMFLAHDGTAWRAMPGGLARALTDEDAIAGRLPRDAVSKDVWVLPDEAATTRYGPALDTRPMAIRRTAGDLPSRVADNFYWLGRNLERLEEAARLRRALIPRVTRPSASPRERADIELLSACLQAAGMSRAEDTFDHGTASRNAALLSTFRSDGAMRRQLARVANLSAQLRDRLTGEVHTILARSLHALTEAMRRLPADTDPRAVEHASALTTDILEFSAAIAGLAAENMVRGGGRLFFDFGRRMERAHAILEQLICLLEQPPGQVQPGRVEAGLQLALELRDSVITYRGRYLAVMQAAPALDLILADEGNPRGLAFQLLAMRDMLRQLTEEGDSLLTIVDRALRDARVIVAEVLRAPNQMVAAARLTEKLTAIETLVGTVADRVSRRYFTLLPVARSLTLESDSGGLPGTGLLGSGPSGSGLSGAA
ncbi:MAG: hypothetical protein EXR07_20265 [Acetobacteraceae bacterium]|nr:hypothetical protein [Acetobacteraceae bacterium]